MAAAAVEEALDDAVFERMERDDHQPSPGLQNTFRGVQRLHQLVQLAVHMDAQRLEGARGGMDLVRARPSRDALYGAHECEGGGDRFFRTLFHDGASDRPGLRLLAEDMDDVGQLVLSEPVDKIGRAGACPLHPHVERPIAEE